MGNEIQVTVGSVAGWILCCLWWDVVMRMAGSGRMAMSTIFLAFLGRFSGMFFIGGKKKAGGNRQLDEKLQRIQMNFENNYKDAAQINLKELEALFRDLSEKGKLSDRQKAYYSEKLSEYNGRMKNFTHKDQKPTWT